MRMRRDGSREKRRKKVRLWRGGCGEERITHNLTEGRRADPAKKAAAQLFLSVFTRCSVDHSPILSETLLFAMLILARKL